MALGQPPLTRERPDTFTQTVLVQPTKALQIRGGPYISAKNVVNRGVLRGADPMPTVSCATATPSFFLLENRDQWPCSPALSASISHEPTHADEPLGDNQDQRSEHDHQRGDRGYRRVGRAVEIVEDLNRERDVSHIS